MNLKSMTNHLEISLPRSVFHVPLGEFKWLRKEQFVIHSSTCLCQRALSAPQVLHMCDGFRDDNSPSQGAGLHPLWAYRAFEGKWT